MNCAYCGAKLKRVQYQRRAADEASEVVTLCPKCPLDMDRAIAASSVLANGLDFELGEYVGPGLTAPSNSFMLGLSECDAWYGKCLVADPTFSDPVDEHEISHGKVGATYDSVFNEISRRGLVRRILSVTRIVSVPYQGALVQGISRVRVNLDVDDAQPYEAVTKIILVKTRIAPGVTFKHSLEWPGTSRRIDVEHKPFVEIVDVASIVAMGTVFTVSKRSGFQFTFEMELASDQYCGDLMHSHLERFLSYIRYVPVVPEMWNLCSALKAISAKSYDATPPRSLEEELKCKYVVKVDGERMLALQTGQVWSLFRFYKAAQSVGHAVFNNACEYATHGWALDIEVTPEGRVILLDVLCLEDGTLASSSRTVEDLIRLAGMVTPLFQGLILRRYHFRYQEALDSLGDVPYSCDGILAIPHDGMLCFKLKPIRAVELMCVSGVDTMYMAARDGTKVFTYAGSNFEEGDIVEIRVEIGREIKPISTLLRLDKSSANLLSVVEKILTVDTLSIADHRSYLVSTVNMCFELRKKIYRLPLRRSVMRYALLDVGTGRGQAVSTMTDTQFGTIVMIEANSERANRTAELCGVALISGEANITECFKNLRASRASRVVVNVRFEDFLQNAHVALFIRRHVGLVTCTFSINHVIDSVYNLHRTMMVPVIGCCYDYGDVDLNGVLVKVQGIHMRLSPKTSSIGKVDWDTDRYEENALTSLTIEAGYKLFDVLKPISGHDVLKHLMVVISKSIGDSINSIKF